MKYQLNLAMMTASILLGTLLGLGALATTTAQPIETTADEPTDLASIIQRERCLNLTSVKPVVTDEETVGVVAIYDDPSTKRAEDYLELYDSDGDLDILPTGYSASGAATKLYRNDGPGPNGVPKFTDVTEEAGVPGTAFGDIALVPAPFLKHPKGIRDVEEWYISTAARTDSNVTANKTVSATFAADAPAPTWLPVYRFYNVKKGVHFYTASEAEKNQVVSTLYSTYKLEGVAYWVAP